MTNLIIFTDTLTAIEVVNGDNVKYVESFSTWTELLDKLSYYMLDYAWIEIKSESPVTGLFSRI